MSDNALRLQVIFSAMDRLSAPIRQLTQGSRGLGKQVAETQRQLGMLKKQEAQIASYRGAETRLQSTAKQLAEAKEKTEALRREIAAVDAPTKKMAAALARAERSEQKAADAHEAQGSKLQELAGHLGRAGVAVERLDHQEAELAERIRSTSRALGSQREKADRMARWQGRGEALKNAGGRVAGTGAAMTAGVTLPFVLEMRAALGAAKESAAATAQVEASIRSMGRGAQFSTERLSAMAGRLQDTSLFDDDDIMRKVTANLLTFGKIGPEVFGRTQQAVVDMSEKMKMDLQASTIMIAKALDSPAAGMMALSKIGAINKEWALANKERIKGLIESGHRDQAQVELLGALEKQFKGSAQAARDATPDAQMQQNWRTFQENVGAVALKVLPPLIGNLAKLLDRFNNLDPKTQMFIIAAVAIAAALGPVLTLVGSLFTVLGFIVPLIGLVIPIVGTLATMIGGLLVTAVGALLSGLMALIPVLLAVVLPFLPIIAAFAGLIAIGFAVVNHMDTIWAWLKAIFAVGSQYVLNQIEPLIAVVGLIRNHWGSITGFFGRVWEGIKTAASAGVAWFRGLPAQFLSIGAMMLQGLLSALNPLTLAKHILKLGSTAVATLKGVLGIHSPSRVFAAIGGHMMGGLALGVDRATPEPMRRVHAAGVGLTRAMAGSLLVAAPAAAARPAAAPIAAAPARPITIHIHPQPGQDPRSIAQAVRDELAAHDRDRARADRSSYRDRD